MLFILLTSCFSCFFHWRAEYKYSNTGRIFQSHVTKTASVPNKTEHHRIPNSADLLPVNFHTRVLNLAFCSLKACGCQASCTFTFVSFKLLPIPTVKRWEIYGNMIAESESDKWLPDIDHFGQLLQFSSGEKTWKKWHTESGPLASTTIKRPQLLDLVVRSCDTEESQTKSELITIPVKRTLPPKKTHIVVKGIDLLSTPKPTANLAPLDKN